MLKRLKLFVLKVAFRSGISAVLLDSGWRRKRLLILGYHGFSQNDEHLWNPALYVPPEVFRTRLQYLQDHRCTVLPLEEGLRRLYSGTLPERSVVLTVDDGSYDSYRFAFPMMKEFGYPATVYLTTYYSDFQRPVFDVMCSYLLWKARGQSLTLPPVFEQPLILDSAGGGLADRKIKAYALERGLSAREKDALLATLADRLAIDYQALCGKRILHIMTREEAAELAMAGFDIQLHTHRHRVSLRRERFLQEIQDNARGIMAIRSGPARHFCYPGGVYMPEFEPMLRDCGIESAATCWPGIAAARSSPLRLPRLLDSGGLTTLEFAGWISGVAAFLPRRRFVMSQGQLVE